MKRALLFDTRAGRLVLAATVSAGLGVGAAATVNLETAGSAAIPTSSEAAKWAGSRAGEGIAVAGRDTTTRSSSPKAGAPDDDEQSYELSTGRKIG
jgi:hypothetical protein